MIACLDFRGSDTVKVPLHGVLTEVSTGENGMVGNTDISNFVMDYKVVVATHT